MAFYLISGKNISLIFFFFQAEDGIRDFHVTGVQTCALPICHSPESPSSRIGALRETSPPRRRFMSTTSCSVTPSRLAISLTWSGRRSPSSSAEILLLALRRLKNSFFWLAVVPIFTSDHERRMYSWIAALIHHIA